MKITETAQTILQKVFNKTYLEQALGNAPWGVFKDDSGNVRCDYGQGCAIGRFLPDTLAYQLRGGIASILCNDFIDEPSSEAREILTGEDRKFMGSDAIVMAYQGLQSIHDLCAREDLPRADYRARLNAFALTWSLKIPVSV